MLYLLATVCVAFFALSYVAESANFIDIMAVAATLIYVLTSPTYKYTNMAILLLINGLAAYIQNYILWVSILTASLNLHK
jgi:hypothetical protein